MKNDQMTFFVGILLMVFLGGSMPTMAQLPTKPLNIGVIPKPQKMAIHQGYLVLDKYTSINLPDRFESLATYFQETLFEATAIRFPILSSKKSVDANTAICVIYDKSIKNNEGYRLSADAHQIKIMASDRGGVVYGLQTLRQLIELNNPLWGHRYVMIPQVDIEDAPQYAWRGFMLDVTRSFFTLDQLKDMVDRLVALKLNRFHLHLSDDQGFRVEMKKHPELNAIGSWRVDHTTHDTRINDVWGRPVQKEGEVPNYGGYYTRDEIKDLVAYAKLRNIEILPEIDVPGHSRAIIASVPQISCDPDKKYYVATGAVRQDNALCPSNENTYAFLDDVFTELAELFPFDYIHIGGDECNKTQWQNHQQCVDFKTKHGLKDDNELQSYFIHRIENIVNAKGKKIIGWDEILDGGLAPNATVMSWRGEKGGIAAAQMNHDVIMSPSHSNYFDLKQGQPLSEPNMGYAQTLLSDTYNFEITPSVLTPDQRKHILGTQANLWTETFCDMNMVAYMIYPRLFALAENAWSPADMKNWDDFIRRLKPQMDRMRFERIPVAYSVFNPWVYEEGNGTELKVWFESELTDPVVHYTLDGTDPTASSDSCTVNEPFIIHQSTVLKAAIYQDGERMGDIVTRHYAVHLAAGASVLIRSEEHPQGVSDLKSKLTDLSYGEFFQGGDTHWMQFNEDADIELALDAPQDIKSVTINTLRHTLQLKYAPKQIEVFALTDTGYTKIGDSGIMLENGIRGRSYLTFKVNCPAQGVDTLRVIVHRFPRVPEGYVPSIVGKSTVLCLDEIVVE